MNSVIFTTEVINQINKDMKEQIKYAKSKVEFFKDAFYKTDDIYYYNQAVNWINHIADLKNKMEVS